MVVASNGGQEHDPLWWRNLQHRPQAEVQVGRARFSVRAHRAEGAERARLWPLLVAANPIWGGYERKTRREIPVVVLRRAP